MIVVHIRNSTTNGLILVQRYDSEAKALARVDWVNAKSKFHYAQIVD
jgi:hypothetical protein